MMKLRECSELSFNNNVVILDNNLFLHQENGGQYQFDYLMGIRSVKDSQIEVFNNNIKLNEAISKKYDFSYKHIIFPSKPTVFKDEFKKIGINITSIFNEKYLDKSVLFPELCKHHYDVNDTHTNDLGIFKIISDILFDIGLKHLPKPIISNIEAQGDLGIMCKFPSADKVRFSGFEGRLNKISRVERYSLSPYLVGNTGHVDFIFNPYAMYNLRIILFGDSFFHSRLHIFESIFSEVIYFRNPYILEEIVKVLEPDIVWTGNAERYLVNVPDAEKPTPWFLNYLGSHFKSNEVPDKVISAFNALFSGRNSKIYQRLFGAKRSHLATVSQPFEKITLQDVKTPIDVDYVRDIALHYESTDISAAFHFMDLAYQARPNGPFIIKKLAEYKRRLDIT